MIDVKNTISTKYKQININKSKVQSMTNLNILEETPKSNLPPLISYQSTHRANSFSTDFNIKQPLKLLTIRNNSNTRFNMPVKKYLSCDIMTNLGIDFKKAKHVNYSNLAKKIKNKYVVKETTTSSISKDSLYSNKFPEIEGPEDMHFFNVKVCLNNKRLANKFEPQQ
jgi:hypothetical protein